MNKISEFSEKLEKWKIFRFIGKFPPTANVPIHVILEDIFFLSGKFSTFSIRAETWQTYRPEYIKFRNFQESSEIVVRKFSPLANVPIQLILEEKNSDFFESEILRIAPGARAGFSLPTCH